MTSRLLRWHFNHHRFSIAQVTLQSSSMIVHIFTLEQKKYRNNVKHTYTHCTGLENLRRRGQRDSSLSVHVLRFLHDSLSDWYVSIRTYEYKFFWEKLTKKTRIAPAAARRREHGLGRYLQGREGRARWTTSSYQRISIQGVHGSRRAINLTFGQLRRHGQHIWTSIYILII